MVEANRARVERIISEAGEILTAGDAGAVGALCSGLAGLFLAPLMAPLVSRGHADAGSGAERLLTMPEVAERLSIRLYTVREMGRRGELPTVRVGRAVRVSEAALARYIQERTRGQGDPVTPGEPAPREPVEPPIYGGRRRRRW